MKKYMRFVFGLREYLKNRITPQEAIEQARKILKERISQRDANFIRLLERGVFGYPKSPYLPLLEKQKISFDDLKDWIEYDGISFRTAEKHLKLILYMLERGFESQLLISQDAGWYRPGEPQGGEIRGFDYLISRFVPMMSAAGIPESTIDHLLTHNPRRALEVPL